MGWWCLLNCFSFIHEYREVPIWCFLCCWCSVPFRCSVKCPKGLCFLILLSSAPCSHLTIPLCCLCIAERVLSLQLQYACTLTSISFALCCRKPNQSIAEWGWLICFSFAFTNANFRNPEREHLGNIDSSPSASHFRMPISETLTDWSGNSSRFRL